MQASIAKNTASMIAASVGQKIISLAYFTIIARNLGAEKIGTYTAALAMTTIFVVFVDLGFTNVFIREASKFKEKIQNYLSNVLFAKIFFGIASYAALFLMLELLGFEPEFKHLVYLSGITMLFDSIHLTVYGSLRSIGNLKYEAIGMVCSQLFTLALGTAFLFFGFPLIFLILAFTISSFLNLLFVSFIAKRNYNLNIVPKYDKDALKMIGKIAVPFALAAIFARIYSYVDVILLKKLSGDLAVGFYSTPSKIVFAFQFIPLALIAALYPRFSEYFATHKERLARTFEQSMKFLFIIAVPISIGIFVLAEDVVIFAFTSKFAASIVPLKILIISLLFSFISFPVGAFLNACGRQSAQTVITGFVLVLNVSLNIVLIPRFGAQGAAAAALAGNIFLSLFGYLIIPKIVRISHFYILKALFQILLSASIMGLAVWYASLHLHFILAIIIGVAVYTVMLFATRAATRPQVKELIGLIKN